MKTMKTRFEYLEKPHNERKKARKSWNILNLQALDPMASTDLYVVVFLRQVGDDLASDHAVAVLRNKIYDSSLPSPLQLSEAALKHAANTNSDKCRLEYVMRFKISQKFKKENGWMSDLGLRKCRSEMGLDVVI